MEWGRKEDEWKGENKKRQLVLWQVVFCTPAGGRTLDTLIKSQVLYQLSYKRVVNSECLLCTPAGGRTLDTLIKSQVLYQLSYKRIVFVLRVQRYNKYLNSPNFFRIFFLKKL